MALLNFPRTFRGLMLVQVLAAASLGAQGFAQETTVPQAPPPLAAPPAAAPPAAAPPAPVAAPPAAAPLKRQPTDAARFAGQRVREVRLEGASIDADIRLREGIVQQPGEILDAMKVRKSIQNLFATGRFANIRADVEPATQGQVDLVFVADENFFVGRITVDGIPRHGPAESQLVNATKLNLGELFEPQKLTVAIEGIQKVLRSQGFYRASVTVDEERHGAIQQVDLLFHIVGGERARVGQVVFEGDPGYTPAELISISQLYSGDEVTSGKAQRAMERLRKKYNKKDRLEAEVVLAKTENRADNNTVDYTLKVHQGPTIDLQVKGASISKGRLKKYVPIYEENAVDDDLLNEGRRNLRDYFQTKGYFDVDVNFKQAPGGPDLRQVEYTIDKGPRHSLSDLVIEGNKYFSEELIRERMLLQPKGWLLSHGRFSQSMLSRDLESITDLYKANGFEEVKVSAEVQDDYQGDTGRMRVAIHVVEGRQTLVHSLKIVGNNSVPESQLRDLLSTTEGQPYSDFNLATDRESIVNHYFNHGFPDVGFDATPVPVPGDASRMDVTYTIREGEPVFVDHVIITGLNFTKPYVVDRELEVHDGAPLSQADMLATQRRLYDLGIFNQVDLAVQNPEGGAHEKNVLLQLTEAKRWTFNYGVGLEIATGSDPGATNTVQGRTGVSPRVSFDATRINFLGRNHTLIFKSRVGRLQQRGLFSYEAPRFLGNENLKLIFTVFYDDTRDVRTFTAQRLEGSAQIEQKVSKITTLLYRLTYRRVKVDPRTLVIDPGLIPLFSRPVRIGIPSFTYIRDKRDDALDSHKGTYTTADVGVAGKFLGSEASFSRFLIQNSTYYPFRKNWVFARSTKVGMMRPFSSTDFIPLPERFFGGGGNSLRGFAINQAGPRDAETGFPLGGAAMFVNNFELRTPTIPLPFVENNLSAVIFHDMGNVFDTAGDMWPGLFRSKQPNRSQCELLTLTTSCDFNYMSHAVGAGVRYKTPIGPVRFDLGYNLNPPTFPIRREGRSDTLAHFNFFFSIGQTF
ncbi:MAG: outer membrane protein assembly factor BamA [Acidobacteriota bacterium]|nr:outer membrane protein assembly factor BamA [Acidobacteriota bacterium]